MVPDLRPEAGVTTREMYVTVVEEEGRERHETLISNLGVGHTGTTLEESRSQRGRYFL